jgi:hypothetical protein
MSEPEAKRQLIEQLTDRFINDPEFRQQMRLDPVGTAERFGIELDEEDRQALLSIDWTLPDEQLIERTSKSQMASTPCL